MIDHPTSTTTMATMPSQIEAVETQSAAISELYRELAESADARALGNEALQGLTREEARFAASQWTMIWRRFRRNKAAMVGGVIVLTYYLVALFGSFVAPYGLTTRFTQQIYLPPQPVYLFDNGQLHPFIYNVTTEFDKNLQRVYVTTDEKIYLDFFAHGESYKFLGLIDTDLHLFQANGALVSILGTDRQGRDMFSRIILG
ncbi:MAG TPA: hypothetical protein VHL11_07740, partial [Phototrophicaceae bacterium]|nr:hypothetical protein [Phototrophicaceae bacterium]